MDPDYYLQLDDIDGPVRRGTQNEYDYNYPDCYLNVAITKRKLDKMCIAYNKGVTRYCSKFNRGLLENDGEVIKFSKRDNILMEDVVNLSSFLREKYGITYCKTFSSRNLPDIISTSKARSQNSLDLENSIEVACELTKASLLSEDLNCEFLQGIKEAILGSNLNLSNFNIWRSAVVNQAQLLTGGTIIREVEGSTWIKDNSHSESVTLHFMSSTLHLSKRTCVFRLKDHTPLIFGREVLLMIADLIQERMLVEMATILGSKISLDLYPTLQDVKKLFIWGDIVLRKFGNKGYGLIKLLEPLCTYRLLTIKKDVFNSETFLDGILCDFSDEEKEFIDQLMTILCSIRSCHVISQLFGLYRLWGHPAVETREGLRKIRLLGAAPKQIDRSIIQQGVRKFKLIFITNYWKKEDKWPELTGNSKIEDLKRFNKPPVVNFNCNVSDLDSIIFLQTFNYCSSGNIGSLITDKSISLTKCELIKCIKENGGIGSALDRRVILKLVNDPMIDVKELLKKIDKIGFSDDDLVIGVLEKERELKIDPRLFALLPYLPRMYFVCTEDMIAKHILPYFPQVTKSWTENSLKQEFINWTSKMSAKSNRGNFRTVLNLDFNKWNTNMRASITDPFFELMDNLMGYKNLIKRTHEFFSKSTIYSGSCDAELETDGSKIKSNDWAWRGHLGGLEGLRQGGWTVVTVCFLSHFCDDEGLEFKIMGQGDNQVLRFDFPVTHKEIQQIRDGDLSDMSQRLFGVKGRLSEVMEQVGLPIKAEETWESCNLFAYGKELIFEGMPLSMDLKKISRMFGFVNSTYPSLDVIVSNIFASGVGASGASLLPVVPYFMACLSSGLEIYRLIDFHPLLNNGIKGIIKESPSQSFKIKFKDQDEKTKRINIIPRKELLDLFNNSRMTLYHLLLRPKILGGIGVQLYCFFPLRGFPDTAYSSLSFLNKIYKTTGNLEIKSVCESCFRIKFSYDRNATALFENPDSLNFINISSGIGKIKELIKQCMVTKIGIKNEWFHHMLKQSLQGMRELCDQLFSLDPLPLLFLADILDATVPGYSSKVTSQVEKSTTIKKLVTNEGSEDLRRRMDDLEFDSLIWSFWLPRFLISDNDFIFGPDDFQNLTGSLLVVRKRAWGKDINGVTVPHPQHLLHPLQPSVSCTHCEYNRVHPGERPEVDYFLITVSNELIVNPHKLTTQTECILPYLGSSTSEKVEAWMKKAQITNSIDIIRKAASILRLVGWSIEPNSPAHQLVKNLWHSITDADPNLLDTSDQSISGNPYHRYHSSRVDRGGFYTGLYGPLTHLNVSSNSITSFSKGSKNVMLHFQACFVYIQSILIHSLMLNKFLPHSAYHFHMRSHKELPVLDEEQLVGNDSWNLVEFPKGERPFTYFPQDELMITKYDQFKTLYPLNRRFSDTSVHNSATFWCGHQIASLIMKSQKSANTMINYSCQPINLSAASKLDLDQIIRDTLVWIGAFCYRSQKIQFFNVDKIRRDILRILMSTSDENFSCLIGFFIKRDIWEYWVKKLNIMVTEYPGNTTSLLRGLRRYALSKIPEFSSCDFVEACMSAVIITNNSKYWDKEARDFLMIQALCTCIHRDYGKDSFERYIHQPFLVEYKVLADDFILNRLNICDRKTFYCTLYGSFESIVKDLSSHKPQRNSFERISSLRSLNSEVKTHRWSQVHQSSGPPRNSYKQLVADLKTEYIYGCVNGHNVLIRDFMMREPRGPTSSVHKYCSLFDEIGDNYKKTFIIGDGTGGTTRAYILKRSDNDVFSFCLKDFSSMNPHTSNPSVPYEYMFLSDLEQDRIITRLTHIENPGNIYDNDLVSMIQRNCITEEGDTIVIFDIEGRGLVDTSSYITHIIGMLNRLRTGYILLKIYLDSDFNVITLLKCLKSLYSEVIVMTSNFSSLTNLEVFIYCKTFIHTRPTPSFEDGCNDSDVMCFREMFGHLFLLKQYDECDARRTFEIRVENYPFRNPMDYVTSLTDYPIQMIMEGHSKDIIISMLDRITRSMDNNQRQKDFVRVSEILIINKILIIMREKFNSFSDCLNAIIHFKCFYHDHPPHLRKESRGSVYQYFLYHTNVSYRKTLLIRCLSYLILRRQNPNYFIHLMKIQRTPDEKNKYGLESVPAEKKKNNTKSKR